MKLAVSQIAWQPEEETEALELLHSAGYAGLEIAPTRVAGENPYDSPHVAADFAAGIRRAFGLAVCSMQSIWYGMQGSMFGPEAKELLAYTKKAILFAQAAGCRNLVFGCPKNRILPDEESPAAAVPFFKEIGAFAAGHGAVVSLEANPPLYGTNFINTTAAALAMARRVNSPGFRVNLDFGTIIENGEDLDILRGSVAELNHVHISEPNLVPIERRDAHKRLAALLREEGYNGYVSIEMKAVSSARLREAVRYVAGVFG